MESPRNLEFPDLEDGLYFFSGGYLIIQGNTSEILRHDNEQNNLEHLHRKYRLRGKLPEIYLSRVRLPEQGAANQGTDQIRGLIRKNLGKSTI